VRFSSFNERFSDIFSITNIKFFTHRFAFETLSALLELHCKQVQKNEKLIPEIVYALFCLTSAGKDTQGHNFLDI
jgi:hypothetical protein